MWFVLAAAVVAEVSATLSPHGFETRPALYVVVIIGYLLAFAGLPSILRRGMALGVAYGIWGASGVALTALLASALFGEPLTIVMGLETGLDIVGVLLVETGSHPAQRGP
ncbi:MULTISPECIES: multidrug efflux SMR transporter [Nocardiaceae]|uniref:Small multidrug resistance pump n=1 Tax=Rhodococcoides corynebacterioides TaxID=53972 RepID=A0ABS2KNF6_9NOCA|nr:MULTISPECIES: SMR family transporter [Rhodococcus]MBM7413467.1 small multidrug resistance pump [Rhodococcus corynebacterioides]MBP1115930.1 small multidrug resistance pump [Rhodococcus sp. PvP016]